MTKARIADLRLLVYEHPTPDAVLKECLDEIERLRRIVWTVRNPAKADPELLIESTNIAAEEKP